MESFQPVTLQGRAISDLFALVMAISALVFLLVVGLLLYALWRFRGRPGEGEPPQVAGGRRLEIAWTAVPLLLLVVLFGLTLATMSTVDASTPSPLVIRVIGHQWWWEYQYSDLGVVTANELHVPVGVPMRLDIAAVDVIHSFWVPRFGWKKDAVPGKTNVMWVHVDQAGVYEGTCTEYCGNQHAWMRIRVVAEPRERFDAWVQGQRQPRPQPAGEAQNSGREIFLRSTCVNCHAIRGTSAAGQVGPDLTYLGTRSTLGAGVLTNSPENLRRWIHDPQAIKPGILMPAFGNLRDDELAALAEYLEGSR